MNFNEFSNYSLEVTNTLNDAVCCGRILLQSTEWEVSFICDFCHRNLPTLLELLRHALTQHMEDVPPEKLRELCAIEETETVDPRLEDCNQIQQETLDDRVVQSQTNETLKEQFDDDEPAETDMVNENLEGANILTSLAVEEELNNKNNKVENESTKMQFEFFNVETETDAETKNDSPPEKTTQKKSRRKTKVFCKQCNVTLYTMSELRLHQRKHGEKPFLCKQCGAGFSDKGNLRVHCFRHLGIKPHACKECPKAFTTSTELKAHMSSHTGERPYKCSQCDKAYANSGDLASHRFLHTNEKRQLCNTCGKTFYSRKSLRNHMSTHVTERSHVCADCNASFTTRKGLGQHMQLHSKVKKYSCQFCGKNFAQAAGVYSHVKTVHKVEKEALENQ